MAITQTFDSGYPQNPWAQVDTKTLPMFYVPSLFEYYVTKSIYSRFAAPQFDFKSLGANMATITRLIPPHTNTDPIGARQLWMESSYMDSEARTVTFDHYGGKMSLHEYDDLITYWQANKAKGLVGIIQKGLGDAMVGTMDLLARNAFFSSYFRTYGDGSASNFAGITNTMKFGTEIINGVHLAMADRDVPYANNPDGMYGDIVCIVSPGIAHDLLNEVESDNEAGFVALKKYQQGQQVMANEIGTYRNIRIVRTARAILYNCGVIAHQNKVIVPISAGDGAASQSVFGTFIVGQPNAVHYIQLDAFSVGDYVVGDIITIHRNRTSANGVSNGVDYQDGRLHNRLVVGIDQPAGRLMLDKPIMLDFAVDLGSSNYAWVTKGRHIHTATFIGSDDAIIMGILRAPEIRTPRPVDDYEELYRVSWKGDFGYQLFEPKGLQMWFGAGSNAYLGGVYVS